MRPLTRLAALAALAATALSCSDPITGSNAPPGSLRLGLMPIFSPAASIAYNELAAFGLEVTHVRVVLTAPDGSVRDSTLVFPAGTDTLRIELAVPLRTAGQTFRADLELRNEEGVVLFSGTQTLVARASNTLGGAGATAAIDIRYTGPGSSARTVSIAPVEPTLNGPVAMSFSAAAVDAAGNAVPNMLVRWTSSDPALAAVVQNGNATATLTSAGRRGTVTLSAITPLGVTGTTRVTLLPLASRLVVISGGGQTGAAGSAVAQPLVVEVQSADNLPVAGGQITFRAITAGGSVTPATAVADANGRASTTLKLGPTVGVYQFEAASGTFAPVTASVTATPAPAATLAINSGDGQSAEVTTVLSQPLTVKAFDRFGALVSGATVQWTKVSGGGAVASATSTTGTDGIASNTYTLGNVAGAESISASLPGATGGNSNILFTARGTAGAPARLTSSGSNQKAPAGTALPFPLIVRVTDTFGNPVANVPVAWRITGTTNVTASFAPPVSATDANGFSQTVVTLGNTTGTFTIAAIVSASVTATFTITVDPAVSGSNPGTLSGFVYQAVTGAALAGVAVDVLVPGSGSEPAGDRAMLTSALVEPTVYSTVTASDGRFATPQLAGGFYDVRFSAQGFVTTTTSLQRINGNTVAEAVPMVPASASPGTISGRIIDATTSQNITGVATVELRAGMNATTGNALQTVQTSEGGNYVFSNVSAGTYTVLVRATGYANASKTGIAVGAQNTSNQNVFVSPVGAAGTVRIVLTWRADPRDLDSYLTGPIASGTSRFTVYYGSQGNCSASPFACLDQDVTGGFGPETMTITSVLPGIYRFTVNKYSGNGPLDQSGARVDVYIDGLFRQSFSVPSGSGRNWTVFELNGNQLTAINTIGDQAIASRTPLGSSATASRAPVGSAARTWEAQDDSAIIAEAVRRNPKGRTAPR